MSATFKFIALDQKKSGLPKEVFLKLKNLNTPEKIQEFLNSTPFNFERKGETCRTVEESLSEKEAHCFEGALIASCALWVNGERPLLLDLKATGGDMDHVMTLFIRDGHYGAISKTNHGVLRYREPVYKTVRELVMSLFHEYFLKSGVKTLRSYSKPYDLSKEKINWISGSRELFVLSKKLDRSPHTKILTPKMIKNLRKAEEIEIKMGEITDWKN
jgi:hypothetical protein